MTTPLLTQITDAFNRANRWFWQTPDRALDDAHEAVLKIIVIEDQHFDGQRIDLDSGQYSGRILSYISSELRNNLLAARIRLSEFNFSRYILSLEPKKAKDLCHENTQNGATVTLRKKSSIVLDKLQVIDEVLSRYSSEKDRINIALDPGVASVYQGEPSENGNGGDNAALRNRPVPHRPSFEELAKAETISDRSSFLPRTILGTLKRVQKELDPKTEEELVNKFRISKFKTIISLRFILLAILIPLLTQQISSNFLIGPIVDEFEHRGTINIFLNEDMEEEALVDLEQFERKLKFEILIGKLPELSPQAMETKLKAKALEIEEEYRDRSADSIKNIFSDLFSFLAFGLILWTSQREIAVLKSFMDDLIYGLSDSAKAFIIILFTDMFVGFHSPHGWEVILEGICRHLGLPESREFIFLFIATFPVILDTVFKYWIFRYLNRISPSAVATYKNMNE